MNSLWSSIRFRCALKLCFKPAIFATITGSSTLSLRCQDTPRGFAPHGGARAKGTNEYLSPASKTDVRVLVGLDGLEPSTLRLSGVRSNHLSYRPMLAQCCLSPGACRNWMRRRAASGGASRDRTGDLMLAKHALSQLSYGPGDPKTGPYARPVAHCYFGRDVRTP